MKADPAKTPYNGPRTTKAAFTDKNTHPLVLSLLMTKECGQEYLGWEPETCWSEIKSIWGVTPSEATRNKIQAIRTCRVSDQPYERWEAFDNVAVALFGMPPRFDSIQRPSPQRAAGAISIMRHAREGKDLSPEVYKYVAATMLDHGHSYGLGPLSPCNKYLSEQLGSGVVTSVKESLESKRQLFSGGPVEQNVQAMKALSVRDFVENLSRMLLTQLEVLI